MTDWIDFAVYFLLVASLWIVYPTAQARLTLGMIADRNPGWFAANRDIAARIAASRWRLWVCYGLGTLCLGVLTAYQLGLWALPLAPGALPPPGWIVLWNLAMAALLAALIFGGAMAIHGYVRLVRLVPLAAQRRATLAPRRIDDFVPRPIRLAVHALVLATLAAWLMAGLLGTHSSPLFWPRLVIMFVLAGIFWGTSQYSVNRRPNFCDSLFGPGYRRWEVRLIFSTQLTLPTVGALRLYEEAFGLQLFDMSRAVQLGLSLFIGAWLLGLSWIALRHDGSQDGGATRAIAA
jgi:hypothetical protein